MSYLYALAMALGFWQPKPPLPTFTKVGTIEKWCYAGVWAYPDQGVGLESSHDGICRYDMYRVDSWPALKGK